MPLTSLPVQAGEVMAKNNLVSNPQRHRLTQDSLAWPAVHADPSLAPRLLNAPWRRVLNLQREVTFGECLGCIFWGEGSC